MADEIEKTEVEETDVLNDVKKMEKRIKKMAFLKIIPKLKDMAKEVNKLKKKTELLLSEFGIDEKDSKRIIDFINSLPDVSLSKRDIEEFKEDQEEEVEDIKEEVAEKVSKNYEKYAMVYTVSGANTLGNNDYWMNATNDNLNMVTLSSSLSNIKGTSGDVTFKI
jgi:hypothetical protein